MYEVMCLKEKICGPSQLFKEKYRDLFEKEYFHYLSLLLNEELHDLIAEEKKYRDQFEKEYFHDLSQRFNEELHDLIAEEKKYRDQFEKEDFHDLPLLFNEELHDLIAEEELYDAFQYFKEEICGELESVNSRHQLLNSKICDMSQLLNAEICDPSQLCKVKLYNALQFCKVKLYNALQLCKVKFYDAFQYFKEEICGELEGVNSRHQLLNAEIRDPLQLLKKKCCDLFEEEEIHAQFLLLKEKSQIKMLDFKHMNQYI